MPTSGEGERPVGRIGRLVGWTTKSWPYRVFDRFLVCGGNLMAAGLTYQLLFAIFAALWVGFAIAGLWITSHDRLFDALITTIDNVVPGLIGDDGLVTPAALQSAGGTLSWTGLIAAVALIWTAIAALASARIAVRTIFRLPRDTLNYALQKVRDLGLAVLFGVFLLLASVLTIITTDALSLALTWLGISDASLWVGIAARVVGLVLSAAINFVTLAGMVRVLSRIPIPWRALFAGTSLGAMALTILSLGSGLLIGGASNNPLLASFAVIIGLLIYLNLASRVVLIATAWIAVGLEDRAAKAAAQRVGGSS